MNGFLCHIYYDPDPPNPGGGGDGGSSDWRSSLPAELKDEASLKDIKDVGALAKSYVHAQRAIGNNVPIPSKDSPQDVWDKFYAKVGRPEKSDGYQIGKVEGADQLGITQEKQTAFLGEAHRLGLSQRQAAGLFEWFAKSSVADLQSHNSSRSASSQQGIQALQSEWGTAYQQNIDQAVAAVNAFGGDDLKAILNETGLGDHPAVIKAFQKIGRSMADDKLFGRGQESGSGMKQSPAEANAKIATLQRDQSFMKSYMNSDDPAHTDSVKQMTELFNAANPR